MLIEGDKRVVVLVQRAVIHKSRSSRARSPTEVSDDLFVHIRGIPFTSHQQHPAHARLCTKSSLHTTSTLASSTFSGLQEALMMDRQCRTCFNSLWSTKRSLQLRQQRCFPLLSFKNLPHHLKTALASQDSSFTEP